MSVDSGREAIREAIFQGVLECSTLLPVEDLSDLARLAETVTDNVCGDFARLLEEARKADDS